jgi:hypothetical protein
MGKDFLLSKIRKMVYGIDNSGQGWATIHLYISPSMRMNSMFNVLKLYDYQ